MEKIDPKDLEMFLDFNHLGHECSRHKDCYGIDYNSMTPEEIEYYSTYNHEKAIESIIKMYNESDYLKSKYNLIKDIK